MRPIRFLIDLPWWTGLVIFLVGNLIVGHSYVLGLPVCLFGAWTFSKLLPPRDYPDVSLAIVGFPLFFLVMLIPARFTFSNTLVFWLNDTSPTVLFGIRAALGIGVGFSTFQGIRK